EPFLAVEFDRFDDNPKDLQAEALASLSHILKQHGIQFDQEWSTSSRTEPRVRGPVDGDVRHIKSLAYV
ncbi:MAG: hypothetical protein LAT83_20450, partial [Kiritimatiellae bacterium]|nr:hypothetical protein [Kiritimatiellia bacterium]